MTRRELLALLAASTPLAQAASQGVRVGAQTSAWKVDPNDFSSLTSVLDKIRKLGYDGFETSFRNVEPVFGKVKDARAQLADSGLRFFGCHIALSGYEAKSNVPPFELIEQVATKASALGAERLILSGAPVSEEGPLDAERLRWKAGALNRAGRACEGLKLRVCYHNNASEFATEANALAKETDPDTVRFLLHAAPADVAGFLQKNHKRVEGIHIQGAAGQEYEAVVAAIRKSHWAGWLIVEGDPKEAGMDVARERIRSVFGV